MYYQTIMRTTLIIFFCLGVAYAAEKYTTRYDSIDLDEILKNTRLYKKYFDCLTGEAKCTPDGKELKDSIPDALSSSCSKCTAKQRAGSTKVIKFLVDNKPEDFAKLQKIYDPQGLFKKKNKDEAEKLGIDIKSAETTE